MSASLIRAAARRLGYELGAGAYEHGTAPCFDDTLFQTPVRTREATAIQLGNDPEIEQAVGGALKDMGYGVETARLDDARARAETLLGARAAFTSKDDLALEAAAAGTALLYLDGRPCAYVPSEAYLSLGTPTNAGLAAAALAGLICCPPERLSQATEVARRHAFAHYSASIAALDALAGAGFFNARAFEHHRASVPQARDEYMWHRERELVAAVCGRSLRCPGVLMEIGVGSGGTTSVLAALGGGRTVVALDDFSYGGRTQFTEFCTAVEPWWDRIELQCGRSQDADPVAPVALLLVDGGHDYEHCRIDLDRFAPHVAAGGLLLVDDYGTAWDQAGVRRATDEWIAHTGWWRPVFMGPKLAGWRRVQ